MLAATRQGETSGIMRRVQVIGGFLAMTALAFLLTACRQEASKPASAGGSLAPAQPVAPAGARLVGQVKLADGGDAVGVMTFLPGGRFYAITDAAGNYAIDGVGVGTHQVMARLAGYRPLVLEAALTIGPDDLGHDKRIETKTLTLIGASPTSATLARSPSPIAGETSAIGSIAGVVVTAGVGDQATSSTLPAGATVALEGTPYRVACDEKGAFLFWSLPAKKYKLTANAPGMLAKAVEVDVTPGKRSTTRVELAPAASVSAGNIAGQVVLYDSQGQLTNEFNKITVSLVGTAISVGLQPDGSFAMKNLSRQRYVVVAAGQGYGQATPVMADLTQSPTTATVTLALTATGPSPQQTGRIVGTAVKKSLQAAQDGADMSGILVALAGTQLTAVTDAQGNFTIANAPPGTYRLIASAQGYKNAQNPSVQAQAGQDVKLDPLILEPDHEAPRVVATDPADGARDVIVRPEMPIVVRFSRKMTPETLRSAVGIEPKAAFATSVGGESGMDLNVMRIVIAGASQKPAVPFRTRYTVTIDATAADFDGVPMEQPYSFSFTTGGPSVIATTPENGGLKIAMGPRNPVVIYFNAKMDPASLTQEALRIRPQTPSSPQLGAFQDPVSGWTRLDVAAAWDPGTQYSVTVLNRACSAVGDKLANAPYVFSFTTPSLVPVGSPPGMPQQPIR
jgi:hypothetical protein